MRRYSSETSSMEVVILGLLVTFLQVIAAIFLKDGVVLNLIEIVLVLSGCFYLHYRSKELGEMFSYMLIPCVILAGAGVLFTGLEDIVVLTSSLLYRISLYNWAVPMLFAVVLHLAGGMASNVNFPEYFVKASVLFYTMYAIVIVNVVFLGNNILESSMTASFVPFTTIASYIEYYISGRTTLAVLMMYFGLKCFIYIPYGYGVAMVTRNINIVLRLLLLIVLPAVIEGGQLLFKTGVANIDDIILALIGAIVGTLLFMLVDFIFIKATDKDMFGHTIRRDYYGRRVKGF